MHTTMELAACVILPEAGITQLGYMTVEAAAEQVLTMLLFTISASAGEQ